jgi:hypothetical protein
VEDRLTVAVARSSTFFSPGKRPLKFCLILRRCARGSRNQRFVCEVGIVAKRLADPIAAISELILVPEKVTPFDD